MLLKGRDFHSRLYKALDMPSIIELDKSSPATGDGGANRPRHRRQLFMTSWENSYAKLARAVLLRQFFRNNSKVGKTVFLKSVEDDLCRFMLAIPLRHGARSLQRIVEACLVSKPSNVRMMHLPPTDFLAEHIETENVRRDGRAGTGMSIDEMIEACRGGPPGLAAGVITYPCVNPALGKNGHRQQDGGKLAARRGAVLLLTPAVRPSR